MIRRLLERVGNHQSANHPRLWALRIEVALLLTLLHLVAGGSIAWFSTGLKRRLPDDSWIYSLEAATTICLLVLLSATVLFWSISVQRTAFKWISPKKRRYPTTIEIFVVVFPITFVTIACFDAVLMGKDHVMDVNYLLGSAGAGLICTLFASIIYLGIHTSAKYMISVVLADIAAICVIGWLSWFALETIGIRSAFPLEVGEFFVPALVASLVWLTALAVSASNRFSAETRTALATAAIPAAVAPAAVIAVLLSKSVFRSWSSDSYYVEMVIVSVLFLAITHQLEKFLGRLMLQPR